MSLGLGRHAGAAAAENAEMHEYYMSAGEAEPAGEQVWRWTLTSSTKRRRKQAR